MKISRYIYSFLLVIAALIMLWSDGPLDVDDALITYRYAEQLATGHGFVYNVGEQILGTSTPLYTLLLAAGYWLGIPTLAASAALNLLSSLGVIWLTMLLAQRLSGSIGAALPAAVYLLGQGAFMRYTMAGMETPLYTCLILLTFWYVTTERYWWAAFFAGITAIMRLDGMAVGGALFLAYVLHHRRLPWRSLLIYGITLLPWTLFAIVYFGSPIPHSMIAKQGHLKTVGISRYWIWQALFTSRYGAPTILLPTIPIGLLHLFRRRGWDMAWTTILLWFLAYLAAYTLVGIDFYEWYVVPVYPVLAIFVGIGLYTLWAALTAWLDDKPWPQLAGYLGAAVLLYWLLPYAQHTYSSIISFQEYLVRIEGPRNRAGQWLQANTPPESTLYAGAIGHLGYYAERYIFDGAGLVTLPEQLDTMQPDYYAVDGGVPGDVECGLIKEFMPPDGAENPPMLISACRQPPLAEIGELFLHNIRIGQHVRRPDLYWSTLDEPVLEMQWQANGDLTDGELTNGDWAVYMHYLDVDGHVIAQTDHPLGRHITGYVRPLDNWPTDKRIYTYVGLPDNWSLQKEKIVTIRLGIWDPTTQEYWPIRPLNPALVLEGGLLIPFHGGDFLLGHSSTEGTFRR